MSKQSTRDLAEFHRRWKSNDTDFVGQAQIKLWGNIEQDGDCWIWTGTTNGRGYGLIRPIPGIRVYAHRLMLEMLHGPLPSGTVVCHHCDTPACVNPAHLFCGTQSHNMRDMHQKGRWNAVVFPNLLKTHCPRGHEYNSKNTNYNREGHRKCRACNRDRMCTYRLSTKQH